MGFFLAKKGGICFRGGILDCLDLEGYFLALGLYQNKYRSWQLILTFFTDFLTCLSILSLEIGFAFTFQHSLQGCYDVISSYAFHLLEALMGVSIGFAFFKARRSTVSHNET